MTRRILLIVLALSLTALVNPAPAEESTESRAPRLRCLYARWTEPPQFNRPGKFTVVHTAIGDVIHRSGGEPSLICAPMGGEELVVVYDTIAEPIYVPTRQEP
jgi:3,4-dihydroxy-2-butanone 4-phosphate synthase